MHSAEDRCIGAKTTWVEKINGNIEEVILKKVPKELKLHFVEPCSPQPK